MLSKVRARAKLLTGAHDNIRAMTPYDTVLYPSYSHPQTHPDNLAVIGKLYGLNPASIKQCRVLELGCGNGTNLIPMAWALPGSRFVGIDLAEVPVRAGQEMAADLDVENVRLVAGDIMQIDASWGEFDYILAHGLYSWVPTEVRDRVMRICQKNLAPNGIAFISYNAFPGAHLRQMIREMMLFHVRQVQAPEERLEQGLALLSFLQEAHTRADDEYAVWLRKELERAINLDRSHLFHDDLAGVNYPVYFHQFMAHAAQHGLQFLGEADFFEMSDHIFAPNIREILKGTAGNRIVREQYLDFLKCRRFRQTLLCRDDAKIASEPDPRAVAEFRVLSKAKEGKAPTTEATRQKETARSDAEGKEVVFSTPKGARVQTDYAAGAEILKILEDKSPERLTLEEILKTVRSRMKNPAEEPKLAEACNFLLQLYSAGVVEFRTQESVAVRRAGELPKASPIARWQIQRGTSVTSLDHQLLEVEDEIGKFLIQNLDGTRGRAQLVDELMQLLKSRDALRSGTDMEIRPKIERELEDNLRKFGKLGLLMQ
jgi:methyltransferase-like protein/2-polyprenyl-3-methyl-5-hydroxy-6-metoxy-1,4-benzoquinol methylase